MKSFLSSPHGKALLRNVGDYFAIAPLLEKRDREMQIKVIQKHREMHAGFFECRFGGWLPLGAELAGSPSQTAIDLQYRQECRKNKQFAEADLIRKVVEDGSVEIRDHSDGTLWLFDWVIV